MNAKTGNQAERILRMQICYTEIHIISWLSENHIISVEPERVTERPLLLARDRARGEQVCLSTRASPSLPEIPVPMRS
ncbi:hypothetical protein FQA47_016150 [Oryzias melastigma]|uniref:Uncharacterized protein n=1 Tax=Oryzias melastigma TaxID=30732 RepID=A0A834L1Q3_ORYME|nr:hypothetical protein FQA47_016150 [Oryzias melastigma]